MKLSRVSKIIAKSCFVTATLVSAISLSGCGGISTAISHKDLKVQTKMSNSIFLPPISEKDQVVYVQIKNTSAKDSLDIESDVVHDLRANGWRVTRDLDKAHVLLQVNVLHVGETNPDSVDNSLAQGYGSAFAGAAVGAVAFRTPGAAVAGGLIAGLGEVIVDSSVHNVTYSIVTDIQVSIKAPEGVKIKQKVRSNLQQGSQTTVSQTYRQDTDWMRYRTRIISYANQVNLKFDKAAPVLRVEISKAISGIL